MLKLKQLYGQPPTFYQPLRLSQTPIKIIDSEIQEVAIDHLKKPYFSRLVLVYITKNMLCGINQNVWCTRIGTWTD